MSAYCLPKPDKRKSGRGDTGKHRESLFSCASMRHRDSTTTSSACWDMTDLTRRRTFGKQLYCRAGKTPSDNYWTRSPLPEHPTCRHSGYDLCWKNHVASRQAIRDKRAGFVLQKGNFRRTKGQVWDSKMADFTAALIFKYLQSVQSPNGWRVGIHGLCW